MDRIICNRKTRTADVFLLKIWQKLSELALPLRILTRHSPAGRSCLPHTQKPEPVKARLRQLIQLAVRDVVQCRLPCQALRQVSQPDTRIDLVQARVFMLSSFRVYVWSPEVLLGCLGRIQRSAGHRPPSRRVTPGTKSRI